MDAGSVSFLGVFVGVVFLHVGSNQACLLCFSLCLCLSNFVWAAVLVYMMLTTGGGWVVSR